MDLFSIGEMVIDFLPGEESGVYIRKVGGAPANVAIAMARNGCQTGLCCKVGNDDFGRFLIRTLKDNGVTPLVEKLEDRAITTMTFVSLNEKGERSFTFLRKPGADMFLSRADVQVRLLKNATIIHAGSCSLSKGDAVEATIYAMEQGHKLSKLVSFDINYREPMWDNREACIEAIIKVLPYVDLLKISDEEIDFIGGNKGILETKSNNGIGLIVQTMGGKGAKCYWNGMVLEVTGIQVDCVDATGAGDAFWGGFLSKLIQCGVMKMNDLTESLILSAMQYGNIAGWLCVQKKGAIESLPMAVEIEQYQKELYS